MLIAIECEKFRSGIIKFHRGLNVVLGDDRATNSIGKSTLLMVVDFAFGGNSLLEHNADVVAELGHHSYRITFEFGIEKYRFERPTDQSEVVFVLDEQGQVSEVLTRQKYGAFLKTAYRIGLEDITFRSLVGLYSRVWGKENLDVYRPLHSAKQQKAKDCVDNLLKTFDAYAPIRDLSRAISSREAERNSLRMAVSAQVIPSISQRQHKKNEERIAEIESEIYSIRVNLASYAANINQLVDEKMLGLKADRDLLLAARTRTQSRLQRTQSNISQNRHIKSKNFAALIEFFPEINTERLAEVEEFHNGVARLLKQELRDAEVAMSAELAEINRSIAKIDGEMALQLSDVAQPVEIIERVCELSSDLSRVKGENSFYERSEVVDIDLKALKSEMQEKKSGALALVQRSVNSEIERIVRLVFGAEKKSPVLHLKEANYAYDVFEDTGTGTAYFALVILDLAVFLATELPVVVHDSVLFKNIENESVARVLAVYASSKKQSFISLDETSKYGPKASELLENLSVVQLSDENVLYVKDWRGKSG